MQDVVYLKKHCLMLQEVFSTLKNANHDLERWELQMGGKIGSLWKEILLWWCAPPAPNTSPSAWPKAVLRIDKTVLLRWWLWANHLTLEIVSSLWASWALILIRRLHVTSQVPSLYCEAWVNIVLRWITWNNIGGDLLWYPPIKIRYSTEVIPKMDCSEYAGNLFHDSSIGNIRPENLSNSRRASRKTTTRESPAEVCIGD